MRDRTQADAAAPADATFADDASAFDPDAGVDAGAVPPPIPTPAIIVAVAAGEVAVLDPATGAIVRTFAVEAGLHPHHLGVSYDGTRVLVTTVAADFSMGHAGHATGGSIGHSIVYVLDVVAGSLARVIDIPATAHNAAFLPDDQDVVLSMAEHGMIQLYDARYFGEGWWYPTGAFPLEVTVSGDGESLVTCNAGDDTLSVFDVGTQRERARFDIAAGPVGAWRSTDGSLWVSSEAAKSVSLLDDDLEGVAATIELDGVPGQAYETPDATELWVALEDRGVIAVFDAETHEAIVEFPAGDKPHGLAFEPSGERAFITDETGDRVLVADVASHAVIDEIAVGAGPNGIAWVQR